jgi:hypothetical protein
MVVIESRRRKNGRYRRMLCHACGHRLSCDEHGTPAAPRQHTNPRTTERRFDADAIRDICYSGLPRRQLALVHNCSHELIRQIQLGLCYRDLLPEGYRTPPRPGDPSCDRCKFWHKNQCSIGFRDPMVEGVGFARDCSLYAVDT